VLIIVAIAFSIAFFLTDYLYNFINFHPPTLAVQIVNSFLGLFLTGTIISIFGRFFRERQLNAFAPIIQAMERIARGDFSIRLENDHEDGIFSNLVTSVNKMALELGQMENMRQEFISNVSHEIQSPLTSIRGFALALEDDTLSPEARHHYLDIIKAESTRLSRLTDDLLKLASLDAEQVKFEPHVYRLDQQLRSLILTCEPQWREKSINMGVSLDEVSITADEDLLSQVWLNLIHNSIKFTGQGGTIRVSLSQQSGQARISIADNGIGISGEDRVHIFERFYKADKSRTRLKEGSGLGLSIVKRIVELHKGEINVESEVGNGTTFTVLLPLGD
jgi:signal transduction histidine kinase